MSAPGQDVNYALAIPARPDQVMQMLVAATSGVPEYQLTSVGGASLILTRRYNPTWAIVVAVIGVFFFLIGLLALLYKETEVTTLTIVATGDGTAVTVAGRCTSEMASRINAALAGGTAAQAAPAPVPATIDVKRCPQCAEQVKAAAKICRFCGFDFSTGAVGATTE